MGFGVIEYTNSHLNAEDKQHYAKAALGRETPRNSLCGWYVACPGCHERLGIPTIPQPSPYMPKPLPTKYSNRQFSHFTARGPELSTAFFTSVDLS